MLPGLSFRKFKASGSCVDVEIECGLAKRSVSGGSFDFPRFRNESYCRFVYFKKDRMYIFTVSGHSSACKAVVDRVMNLSVAS